MQNPPIFPNGFKRRLLHIPKGPILHYFRDPHFGVSRGADRPSAGFVVSGHVNLCHFLLSPPGMGSPDPSEWVLVSHAVEIPDPPKGVQNLSKRGQFQGCPFRVLRKSVFVHLVSAKVAKYFAANFCTTPDLYRRKPSKLVHARTRRYI